MNLNTSFTTLILNTKKIMFIFPTVSGAGSNLLFYGIVGTVAIIILLAVLIMNFRANKSKEDKEK